MTPAEQDTLRGSETLLFWHTRVLRHTHWRAERETAARHARLDLEEAGCGDEGLEEEHGEERSLPEPAASRQQEHLPDGQPSARQRAETATAQLGAWSVGLGLDGLLLG
eukprot:197953-Rhodomonas_salina.1